MPFSQVTRAKRSDVIAAIRIGVFYLIVAAIWILLSDRAVELLVPADRLDRITGFQTIKGLSFVVFTAVLLSWMVLRRINQIRQAEREAEHTQARMLAIADHFPGVLYIRDPQNRIRFIRGDLPQGVSAEAILDKTDESLHDPVTWQRLTSRDQEVIATAQSTQLVETVTIRGRTIHYLVHRFPLTSPEGKTWVAGLAVDITERQTAEDRIREMARELEQASRMKDQFLANLSHELRTPITAIRLWTEVLRDPSPDDMATIREAALMIQHSALTQTLLIEDLLDITRIIGGRLKVQFEPMRLNDVVRKTVELLLPMAEEHRVKMVVNLDASGPCPMLGDARRVQQVVWNLLTNAIKFSEPDGEVTCTVSGDGDDWLLTVVDHGKGIPSQNLPHVFDRFRQNEQGRRSSDAGIGIGLSIVKHLVEAHGGSVTARSEGPGRGATFTARFPAASNLAAANEPDPGSPEEEAASPPKNGNAGAPVAPLEGVRILLVEDDTDSRTAMTLLLGRAGAVVTAVDSAEAALALHDNFDLLLSDIGLPDRDGYQLIRELRSRSAWQGRPAIACSAYALPEDRTRALEAGFDRFMTKPIEPEDLIQSIAAVRGSGLPSSPNTPSTAATT